VPRDQSLHEVLDKQWELFLRHAELAKKHNLPLVIHVRDAQDEMIKRLKDFKIEVPGVIHCYSGNWEQAQEYLNLGFYLGFTGVVTFPAKKTDLKPQEKLLEVIKKIPLDRILIETDAPYLAPQKYRGKRCEPWMVEEVAEFISKVRGIKLQEFVKLTSDNAKKLFGIN
jgi:TatD DNase family protein